MTAASPAAPTTAPNATGAGRSLWLATLAFTLVVAVAGYAITGTPRALWGDPAAAAASAEGNQPTPEQIEAMVQKLAERLKSTPDDAQGWQMLARSYLIMGRFAEAADASAQVLRLQPGDPNALADHADVLALKQGRSLEGEPMRLIERALQVDPGNLKALALAGAAAFDRGDAAEAARRWQRVVDLGPPDSPVVQQAREGVAEAQKLMAGGAAASARPSSAPAAASGPAPTPSSASAQAQAPAPASAPQGASSGQPGRTAGAESSAAASVRGQVRLDASLAAQAGPEETVFVFARAVREDGSAGGMPLAILRRQVKDLPISFTLDDSLAMGPGMGISSAKRVVVSARISRSGQAMPQPGDLEGASSPVEVGASTVDIVISRVVR